MGLDLEPLGRARTGQEAEWQELLGKLYADEALSPAQSERLIEISIPAYADIGAPQVGSDVEADRWLIARARRAGETKPDADIIASQKGYYVLDLLRGKSDGIPAYSNSAFGYVAETSFRGEFLSDCTAFLDQATIDLAWRTVIPPAEAVAYGEKLLARLDRPANSPLQGGRGQDLSGLQTTDVTRQEQRQIIDVAGRWYVFWGRRGNPIWANY